jgi:hypothetical protein
LLYEAIPTLDASKHWDVAVTEGARVWQTRFPDETTKTDKQLVPVVMQAATKEHPAQVQAVQKDVVVGRVTVTKRSGCATAQQKADSLRLVDELMIEVKAARMRANETPVVRATIADKITALLLSPFAGEAE